jgi:hypothetical protein
MKKAHLVILSEEHDPVIKGQCSSCPDITFVVDRTAESCLRVIHDMFDAHFQEISIQRRSRTATEDLNLHGC